MFISLDPVTVSSRPDSNKAPSITTDTEEATRAELLRQIETSQRELQTQLAELRYAGSGHNLLDQGETALRQLASLHEQLAGGARGMTLSALRGQIASAVAGSQSFISGAVGAGQTTATEQAALSEASSNARRAVLDFNRDFYERRIFDPYLRFSSVSEEETYRQREEARRRAIEAAINDDTPESILRANRLQIAQLEDAGIHGAERSPAFRKDLDKLNATADALAARLHRGNGVDMQADIDPLDAVRPATDVSPALIAALRASGVKIAAQDGTGSGVTIRPEPSAHRRV